MKLEGFAFSLSDGNEIYVAPVAGVDSCTALHDGFELTIDVKAGAFKARHVEPGVAAVGVLEFKKAQFEVPEGGMRSDDNDGNVGVLWCRATGCCCNCGAGWICG